MRAIVKAALAIPEMQFGFECICADDNKEPEDYTDEAIVSEAEYRLSTYFEDGHINNDEMRLGATGDPIVDKVVDEFLSTRNLDLLTLKIFVKRVYYLGMMEGTRRINADRRARYVKVKKDET